MVLRRPEYNETCSMFGERNVKTVQKWVLGWIVAAFHVAYIA